MKYLSILLTCILVTSCHSLPSDPESWDEVYARAEQAYSQGDFARSGVLAEQSAQRAREQEDATSLSYAQAATLAGAAHLALAEYEQAKAHFVAALPIILASPDTSAEDKAAAYNNLAEINREQGKHAFARSLYQQALRLVEESYPDDSREVADAAAALALGYHSQGELGDAEPLYRRALAIFEAAGAEDRHLAGLLGNLADLMWRLDRLEEAEAFANRALAIETRELGPVHPSVASTLNTLGVIHDRAKRYDKALASYERALAIRTTSLGPDHPSVATTHSNIAATYEAMKEYDKAEAHFVEAIRMLDLAESRRLDAQANRRALAGTFRAADQPEKAHALERLLEEPH